MPAIQIAGLIVALLVTSGAFVFFIRYGTRLAFAERDAATALKNTLEHGRDLAANQARQMLTEQTVKEIRDSLSKLGGIDEIKATCEVLKERVEQVRSANAELRSEVKEMRLDVKDLVGIPPIRLRTEHTA